MPNPQNYVLTWQEDDRPVIGDGLSRTSNPRAVLWSVTVGFGNNRPMFSTVRAMSKAEAKTFTRHRHPTATTITVLGRTK